MKNYIPFCIGFIAIAGKGTKKRKLFCARVNKFLDLKIFCETGKQKCSRRQKDQRRIILKSLFPIDRNQYQ